MRFGKTVGGELPGLKHLDALGDDAVVLRVDTVRDLLGGDLDNRELMMSILAGEAGRVKRTDGCDGGKAVEPDMKDDVCSRDTGVLGRVERDNLEEPLDFEVRRRPRLVLIEAEGQGR